MQEDEVFKVILRVLPSDETLHELQLQWLSEQARVRRSAQVSHGLDIAEKQQRIRTQNR